MSDVPESTNRATWTLFDYGVGNLHSLKKAVEAAGHAVSVTAEPADLHDAPAILLPGVGAFGAVMDALAPAADALRAHHEAGRPLLGICIGMQVLYEGSDEDPGHHGLGILPGRCIRIPASAGKVPHMGWNTVRPHGGNGWFVGDPYLYYVHSYAAPVGDHTIATTTYGTPFSAAVRAGNTIGLQFHPEKSSKEGARILATSLESLVPTSGAP